MRILDYTEKLPDFTCVQITKRYSHPPPHLLLDAMGRSVKTSSQWDLNDTLKAEITYSNFREYYKLVAINDQPVLPGTEAPSQGGSSSGEYCTTLRSLFNRETQAEFEMEAYQKIQDLLTLRIGYKVGKEHSNRVLSFRAANQLVAESAFSYRGHVWLHPVTFLPVQLDLEVIDIPRDFPIARAYWKVEYRPARLSTETYWLPARAEFLISLGRLKQFSDAQKGNEARNLIEFRDYQRFEAKVKLLPD